MNEKYVYAYDVVGARSSGARFYRHLSKIVNDKYGGKFSDSNIILFNVYSPIYMLIIARILRKKVILRVDGLWNDRITIYFLKNMNVFWRSIFYIFQKIRWFENFSAHFANFIYDNYKVFFKILVANGVIYQSQYSKLLYENYFFKKNTTVILNGTPWVGRSLSGPISPVLGSEIRFCVIYSKAPLKGIYESVKFVEWLNTKMDVNARLLVIGFDGVHPPFFPDDFLSTIESSPFIELLGVFQKFGVVQRNAIQSCHFYLSLSRADPCPNALVEAMSFGLPVLGLGSGGVSEIVGSAGVLVPYDDFSGCFFFGSRYEYMHYDVPFYELFHGLEELIYNYEYYYSNVAERFSTELDIKVVAENYSVFLEKFK